MCVCAGSDVTTQSAVFRRVVSKHRRVEPHQLQHAIRLQDADDDLSRHRPRRRYAVALGHLQLDSSSLRRVSFLLSRLSYSYMLVKYVCVCVWMLTRMTQIATAAHRDL